MVSMTAPAGKAEHPAPPAAARRRTARGTGPRIAPYGFLVPATALFAVFFALPIGYAVYLSFRKVEVKGLGLGKNARSEIWAGLQNYTGALKDPEFTAGALRVLGYGALLIPVMLGLALLFALMLDTDRVRLRAFSRLAIFLPYAIPGVVAALLWGFLYLPSVSPFHYALDALGLPHPDLLSGGAMYGALANIAVWGGTGFNMIVIYTALRAVPSDIYEAARIDGCSELQIALRIKIPMVMPSLVLTFFFSMIATLQVFGEPMTLRPMTNAIPTTWSPLMKVYVEAFAKNDIYAAAATSMIIAVVVLVLSFGFLKLANARTSQGESR